MASVVGICNNALIKLGEDTIISLTEDSKQARLCAQIFNDTRDLVLRDHPWNFAVRRVELAQLTTTPAFGYNYEYQLPSNALRVLGMEDDDVEFKVEGRKLLTDESTAKITYIYQSDDPAEWDALFREALAAKLAAELAIPLADSNTLQANMVELYNRKISDARSANATEGTPEVITAETWLDVRY